MGSTLARAQTPDSDSEFVPALPPLPDSFRAFSEPIPGVDWDSMQPEIIRAIERVFEQNGWNREPDRYARDVACRIAAIPPWNIAERFDAFTQAVSMRYRLSPEQSNRFHSSLMRESTGFLFRNGPALLAQAREALQGHAKGIPYTPEQVARWSRDAEPIFRDMAESVDRLSAELETGLDDEMKEQLRIDVARYNERQRVVERMTARWANGEWDPAQWGLDDDPIQSKGMSPSASDPPGHVARPGPPSERVVVIPTHWIDHDPATWIALVLEIRDRYALDSGQMSTAWSIHGELVERAAAYVEGRSEEMAAVPVGQRSTHDAYRPIRDVFAELRQRLEAVPTSSQRELVNH